MPKLMPLQIPFKTRQNLQKRLFHKMAKLKTATEMEKFLKDLLTESELIMVTRRLQIAKMLLAGQGGYFRFVKELK